MSTSTRRSGRKPGPKSVVFLSEAQLERKRENDRESQRIIRQRTREHIENLERQVAELSGEKDQALQRNSELEAQNTALQRQVTHMALLLQGSQSLVGLGHIDIAPAYGTNNYIIPKILSKRKANRGVGQDTTTGAIFTIYPQCTPETNNYYYASQRPGTSQLLSNGDDSDVASRAPSLGQSGMSAEMAMGSCPLGQY